MIKKRLVQTVYQLSVTLVFNSKMIDGGFIKDVATSFSKEGNKTLETLVPRGYRGVINQNINTTILIENGNLLLPIQN